MFKLWGRRSAQSAGQDDPHAAPESSPPSVFVRVIQKSLSLLKKIVDFFKEVVKKIIGFFKWLAKKIIAFFKGLLNILFSIVLIVLVVEACKATDISVDETVDISVDFDNFFSDYDNFFPTEEKSETILKEQGISLFWTLCKSDNDGTLAYQFAQEFLKDRLSFLSSAEFPAAYNPEVFVDLIDAKPYEECTWEIRSYADFAGVSGARWRAQYTAKVKFNVSNATWYLVDLGWFLGFYE